MHESQRLNIEAARIYTFATFSNRQLERFKDTFILLRNAKYLKFVAVKTDGKYKTEHKCIVRLRGKQRYLEEARNLDDQLGNIKVFNLICQNPILRLSSDPEYKIALCFQTDQWPYRVLKNRLVHMADFLVLCNAVFCSKEMQILKANRKTGLY